MLKRGTCDWSTCVSDGMSLNEETVRFDQVPRALANADLSLPDTAVVFNTATCPWRPHKLQHKDIHRQTAPGFVLV